MPNEHDPTTRHGRRLMTGAARPAATTALSVVLLLSLSGGAAVACAGGGARATPTPATTAGNACAGAPYRAFDFWAGRWEVSGRRGRAVGASQITPTLGGCAMEERWRVAAGLGGRSVNAYDRRDGRWHQFWVDRAANVLRLSGDAPSAGVMVLASPPRWAGDSVPPHDRVTWRSLDSGRVRQTWDTSVVAAADDSARWRTTFDGVYAPRTDSVVLQPLPSPPTTTSVASATQPTSSSPRPARCSAPAGPYRALDFLLGDWDVHVARRDGRVSDVVGRRTVVTDLGDCLTVGADFDASGTYRGISYAAYDARSARWIRESVDDEGRRVVLVGEAPAPGAPVVMLEQREPTITAAAAMEPITRVVWRALPDGGAAERWERSADGGATWRVTRELVLTRR